jgi:hypothetical protein
MKCYSGLEKAAKTLDLFIEGGIKSVSSPEDPYRYPTIELYEPLAIKALRFSGAKIKYEIPSTEITKVEHFGKFSVGGLVEPELKKDFFYRLGERFVQLFTYNLNPEKNYE